MPTVAMMIAKIQGVLNCVTQSPSPTSPHGRPCGYDENVAARQSLGQRGLLSAHHKQDAIQSLAGSGELAT